MCRTMCNDNVYPTHVIHVRKHKCHTCVGDTCIIQMFYIYAIPLKHHTCITGVTQLAMY